MMLSIDQTKQGINHRQILDFRFQTRAQEVQMEIGGIVKLSPGGELTHQHPISDQVWESTMKSKF